MTRILVLPFVLVLLILQGCGGGSGGGNPNTQSGKPSGLTYGDATIVFLLGGPIDPLVPTVVGTVDTWNLTPALPTGLAFDAGTGVVSGTPTVLAVTATYTLTASNSQGSATFEFELRVAEPARFAFTACIDGTVGAHSVDAVTGQMFHHGFGFDPAAMPIAEQVVPHPMEGTLYVPNLGDTVNPSNISVFCVAEDGGLVAMPPVAVGPGPHRLALRSDGMTAYATAFGADELFAYDVDPVTYDLVPFATASVAVGDGPLAVVVDAFHRFVYVGNRTSATISVVPLDLVTGEPTGSGNEFFVNNGLITDLGVEPSGRLLFVTLENFNLLLAMVIDENTGNLTVVGSAPTGAKPTGLAVHPTGEFVLVCNGDGTVSSFGVDLETGELTPGPGDVAVGPDPAAIEIDDAGLYAYVTCRTSDELVSLDIDDPLQPVEVVRARSRRSPLGVGLINGGRPVRPRARALYALNVGDATVSVYGTHPTTGELTEVGLPTSTGAQPSDLVVDPFNRFVWVLARGDDEVQSFVIDPANWSLLDQGASLTVGDEPAGIAVDPAGRFVFITSAALDSVTSYAVDPADGTLAQVDSLPTGDQPGSVTVDPTGQFVIVANVAQGSLSAYRVGLDGTFTEVLSGDAAPGSPTGLHFAPDGSRFYVALTGANLVVPYTIDAITGNVALQPPGAAADLAPSAMVPSPVDARAYCALIGPGDGALAVYGLDGDGNPALAETLTNVGLTPVDVVVDPIGAFLYTANLAGDDVGRFALDEAGDASFVELVPCGDGPVSLDLLRRIE